MSEEERLRRFTSAVHEIEHGLDRAFYHFVINDNLQTTVQLIDSLNVTHHAQYDDTPARQAAAEMLAAIKNSLNAY